MVRACITLRTLLGPLLKHIRFPQMKMSEIADEVGYGPIDSSFFEPTISSILVLWARIVMFLDSSRQTATIELRLVRSFEGGTDRLATRE